MENSIGDGRASAADGATDGVAGGAADGAAEVATDGAAEHLGGATERGDRRGPPVARRPSSASGGSC